MRAFLSVQHLCVPIAFAVVALIGCTTAGCAFHSGVTIVGGGEFIITKQAVSGFSETGEMRKDSLVEASRFCSSKLKDLRIIGLKETQPPYSPGNYPHIELRFECDPSR